MQQPAMIWGAQLAGTIGVALAIYFFFGSSNPMIRLDPEWMSYGFTAILGAAVPALWYLRGFKAMLDADRAAARSNGGVPQPELRMALLRKMSVGGALCELPLVVGVVHLLAGGGTRLFVAAACVTLVLRLSFRPFTGGAR
jgi:hypothetical protein